MAAGRRVHSIDLRARIAARFTTSSKSKPVLKQSSKTSHAAFAKHHSRTAKGNSSSNTSCCEKAVVCRNHGACEKPEPASASGWGSFTKTAIKSCA